LTRIGIVADVHSNLLALNAVTSHADGIDEWWCLGDIVGYGPWPNECVEVIKSLGAAAVSGNHDLGAVGSIRLGRFNRDARTACEWTGRVLGPSEKEWLGGLAGMLRPEGAGALLVHGSPSDPVWEYVLSPEAAAANFRLFDDRMCLNGHSHVPYVFTLLPGEQEEAARVETLQPEDGEVISIRAGARYMVNAGSVGQPRDGDPKACYVVLDLSGGWFAFHRVAYDVGKTRARMEQAGLPAGLASRLSVGR
jgi:diadenosine tetraphosphatase ApaH/serine/threonine PP2A family protein phosphatase